MITDNGRQVASAVFAQFMTDHNIKHDRSTQSAASLQKHPLDVGRSPTQLFLGRRLKTTVPTTSKLLQPGQEVPKSNTAKWSSVKRSRNTPSTKKRAKIILMGTPNSVIELLQKIQNFAARLVLLAPRHQHSTPLLEKLHWLPISECIKYKLACMCFSVCVSVYVFQCVVLVLLTSRNCCMSTLRLVYYALVTPAC